MERVVGDGPGHKTSRKGHFFVIEKSIEDVKQEEKHVPDLLEPMMRPTDPVKEGLRRTLMEMTQFGSKIRKNQGFNFFGSRKSDIFPPEANASLLLLASRF